MKKLIAGIMLFGMVGVSHAQLWYAPWYAQNFNLTGNGRLGGTLDVAGTSTFVSSVTVVTNTELRNNLSVGQTATSKWGVFTGTVAVQSPLTITRAGGTIPRTFTVSSGGSQLFLDGVLRATSYEIGVAGASTLLTFKGTSFNAALLLTTPALYDVYYSTDGFNLWIASGTTPAAFKCSPAFGATP